MSALRGLAAAWWMAQQSSDLGEICGNFDISKALTGISFEIKLALGRKSDDYLTEHSSNGLGEYSQAC